MSERIYKLQPNRTIQLRGFNDLGAAAALHSATATSFKVSGIFRDPADFCVLSLYDADNFYEHPSLKHLPDMNFDGLTLSFDVHYTGLRNLDSPRYPIIDWPFLDVIRGDGTTASIRLFDQIGFVSGNWNPASIRFRIVDGGMKQWDHIVLWYLNQAYEYVVPQLEAGFAFNKQGAGFVHSIVVAGTTYAYTELDGDFPETIAQRLLEALGPATDYVSATRFQNQVNLTAARGDGQSFTVSSTSASNSGKAQELWRVSAAAIAADLARQCRATDWTKAGADIPIAAESRDDVVTFTASKAGVDGNALSMYAVCANSQLTTDIAGGQFTGGNSDATWHVSIDFTTAKIPDIRKMWLTFAPPLSVGKPFTDTEWEAVFTNWTLSGPEEVRRLQVAGPGSFRIEDNSSACHYDEPWTVEAGFYSRGYAQVATKAGNTVTIQYNAATAHELWLGTSLYSDRGSVMLKIDAGPEFTFDALLDTKADPAVITRRQLGGTVPAGQHVVTLRTVNAKPFYFDFLDVVVRSDVPAPMPPRTNISPALDYSTDHTYKLPPARILWMFDQLGFAGPVNEYIGVFWWNQRKRDGATIPQVRLTFSGGFQYGDQVWLNIADTRIGRSVLSIDTNNTLAKHFAAHINTTFVGLWAQAAGDVLTITSHSPTRDFQFDLAVSIIPVSGSTGAVTVDGTLKYADYDKKMGHWMVDPTQTPALNRGAREWHADFYRECKARNREVVSASSMELVLPPDELPARFHNGDPVTTDVGYGSDLWSAQCAFNAATLAYQTAVFDNIAALMSGAGVTPNLQFGEYCWWYFRSDKDGSMALYDPDTQAAAQSALGRPLALFTGPDDDPQVNGGADAIFLRNRLRNHVAALIAAMRAKYPGAKFEVLFPYDVNYPVPSGVNHLGGRLLRFINFPIEWANKQTSGLDRLKMEGLDWGAATRSLDLVRDVMEFPIQLGWPIDSIRYMLPVFNGGCPWLREYRLGKGIGIPVINLWAFDHVCIFGLPVAEPSQPPRAARF